MPSERSGRRMRIVPSPGALCLAFILKWMSRKANARAIALVADVAPGQTSTEGLARASERQGVPATPVRWSVEGLRERAAEIAGRALLHFPAGGHSLTDGGDFLIFEDFDGETCYAASIEAVRTREGVTLRRRRETIPLAKLERWWCGMLLVLGEAPPEVGGAAP